MPVKNLQRTCESCGKLTNEPHAIEIRTDVFENTKKLVCWDCINKMELVISDTITKLPQVWKRAKKWKFE